MVSVSVIAPHEFLAWFRRSSSTFKVFFIHIIMPSTYGFIGHLWMGFWSSQRALLEVQGKWNGVQVDAPMIRHTVTRRTLAWAAGAGSCSGVRPNGAKEIVEVEDCPLPGGSKILSAVSKLVWNGLCTQCVVIVNR
jgi:hypothetical protein